MALKKRPVTIKVHEDFFSKFEEFRSKEARKIGFPRFSQIDASEMLVKGGLFDKSLFGNVKRKKR